MISRFVLAGMVLVAAACGGGARHSLPLPTALTPAPTSSVPASPTAPAKGVPDSAHPAATPLLLSPPPLADSLAGRSRPDSTATLGPLVRPVHDSTAAAPAVRGEEVAREAERLFGAEGKEVIGAAPTPGRPLFDIDVTTFATNRRVLEYLEFFQVDARDRFEIWLSRLGRYEGMIRERLRTRGLPEDLIYLTLIESGLSNTAVSRARAVGMWQFMASTARLYGLTVDPWVDERRDPYKATDAAVTYLSDLVQRLGSVYLAAAAYNAGVARIERGVARLPGEQDTLTDNTFFQLADRRYLRRETRDYVPKLIAASLIAKQPDRYGFTEIQRLPPLVFDEITIPDATGLDVVARLADTSIAALLELNPRFVRGITPPGREVTVRVPRGRGALAAARYDTLPATERVTFLDHYVARGQTLSEIARRYRVTVTMIQSANPQLRPHALRVGQRIMIPVSGRIVPASAWSVPPEGRVRRISRGGGATGGGWGGGGEGGSHRVRAGETATQIARRFGVSLTRLLDYNGLTVASVIRAGDVLKIPAAGACSSSAATRAC